MAVYYTVGYGTVGYGTVQGYGQSLAAPLPWPQLPNSYGLRSIPISNKTLL